MLGRRSALSRAQFVSLYMQRLYIPALHNSRPHSSTRGRCSVLSVRARDGMCRRFIESAVPVRRRMLLTIHNASTTGISSQNRCLLEVALYLAVRGSPSGHALRTGVRAPKATSGDATERRGELVGEYAFPIAELAPRLAGEAPASHGPSPSSARISSAASTACVSVNVKRHTTNRGLSQQGSPQ